MKKNILKIILGTIIVFALLLCYSILADENLSKGFSAAYAVFLWSLPCLIYAKIYDNPKYRFVAISGFAAAAVGAVISVLNIFLEFDSDAIRKLIASLFLIVIAQIFISHLLSHSNEEKIPVYLRIISICSIIIFNLFILASLWDAFDNISEGAGKVCGRLLAVSFVLSVFGYISTLISFRIYKKNDKANIKDENESNAEVISETGNDANPMDDDKSAVD